MGGAGKNMVLKKQQHRALEDCKLIELLIEKIENKNQIFK